MPLTEFLRSEHDLQERKIHPDYLFPVFTDDDVLWRHINEMDMMGTLPMEEQEKLFQYRPDIEKPSEYLGQISEQLLANPQIRLKGTLHVSGNAPTKLSMVGMLNHWQHRYKMGMIENPDKLLRESFQARAMMNEVLSATAEYKHQDIHSVVSLIGRTIEPYTFRLPSEVSNNIPEGLVPYDVMNAIYNTGIGLKLATISQDMGYEAKSYEQLMSEADQEFQDYFYTTIT